MNRKIAHGQHQPPALATSKKILHLLQANSVTLIAQMPRPLLSYTVSPLKAPISPDWGPTQKHCMTNKTGMQARHNPRGCQFATSDLAGKILRKDLELKAFRSLLRTLILVRGTAFPRSYPGSCITCILTFRNHDSTAFFSGLIHCQSIFF